MSRVNRLLSVLDNPAAPPLSERNADEEMLLTMLVHMFFADGVVADAELNVLKRLVGDKNDAKSLVAEAVGRQPVAVRRPEKETRPKLYYVGAHQATLDPLAARRPDVAARRRPGRDEPALRPAGGGRRRRPLPADLR